MSPKEGDMAMRNDKLSSAIELLRYRYRWYSKRHKGKVLDELEEQFSVDRKYLVRLLSRRKGG
jgi:hypothetical protein